MQYVNSKGADQPGHPRSLISAFVVRWLDSVIPLVSIPEISSLYLASVPEQAGLSLTRSKTPKTGFLVTKLNYRQDRDMCQTSYRSGYTIDVIRKISCMSQFWVDKTAYSP